MIVFNNDLYFSADDGLNGREIWKSDGTTGGTSLAFEMEPGPGNSAPRGLTVIDGELVFAATSLEYGREVFAYDGTAVRVHDVRIDDAPYNPTFIYAPPDDSSSSKVEEFEQRTSPRSATFPREALVLPWAERAEAST